MFFFLCTHKPFNIDHSAFQMMNALADILAMYLCMKSNVKK